MDTKTADCAQCGVKDAANAALIAEKERLEAEVERLEAKILELEGQQGANQVHAGSMIALGGGLNASLVDTNKLTSQNNGLKIQVRSLEAKVKALEARNEALEGRVTTLEGKLEKYAVSEARLAMGQFVYAFRGKAARLLFPDKYDKPDAESRRRGVTVPQLMKMVDENKGDAALQQKVKDLDKIFSTAKAPNWRSSDFAEEMGGLETLRGPAAHLTSLSTENIRALLELEGGSEAAFCRRMLDVLIALGEMFAENPLC